MNCLVIDADEKTRKFARKSLSEFGAQVQFMSAGEALETLPHARYEGIFVYHNGSESADKTIKAVRATPSNHSAVIIALAKDEHAGGMAGEAGATLIAVTAQSTREALARTFRASYGMMVRQRLRSSRVPVKATMLIRAADRPPETVALVNVGETGACFQARDQLPRPLDFSFAFGLLQPEAHIEGEAFVVWSKLGGLSGAQFVTMPKSSSDGLRHWLAARLGAQEVDSFLHEFASRARRTGSR